MVQALWQDKSHADNSFRPPPHHNGCFVISDSSFPWKHFTMVPVGTDVKRDPECCCVALACSYWCKLTVVTAAAFLGTDIYRVSEPSGIIPDMFQVLVGYQLIRCQVSHPFLFYLSIITHPFFSLLSITLLGGMEKVYAGLSVSQWEMAALDCG